MKKITVTILLTIAISITANSQITINAGAGYTATNLVNYLVPAANVTSVSNQNILGVMGVSGRYQAGHFTTATTTQVDMDFNEGVVLSTGNVNSLPLSLGTDPGDVAQISRGYTSSTAGEIRGSEDADAENLINPENCYNAAILEFDFIPLSSTVEFRYVFGSEEYDDGYGGAFGINYNCSSYNDKFAFLLSGPGISGGQGYTDDAINIARLSNNSEVGINSVNNGNVGSSGGAPNAPNCTAANPAWIQNSSTAEFNGWIDGTQLNGNTNALTASYTGMIVGMTYTIRLVIADAKDGAYDSAVYLEAGSFTTNPTPLSAEVIDFTPSCTTSGIEINWTTKSETNNDFFEIERATAGGDFETIGTIQSNGTNNETMHYNFTDYKAQTGINYYKLSQTDFNGDRKEIQTVAIENDCINLNSTLEFIGHYSSGDNQINVNLSETLDEGFTFQLINSLGQQIGENIFMEKSNKNQIKINLEIIPSGGIYIMKIITSDKEYTSRVYVE